MKRLYALSIAGGRGERLKPITDDLPKSMVPVDGRPLIERQAAWFVSQGVTDVVFLCGYLGEKIQEHFQDGARFGFRAHYSFEETPLGRGGAVRKGLELVPANAGHVIVTNGDNLTSLRLDDLVSLHFARNAVATMMLTPFQSQYGVVEVGESDMVTSFVEKGRLPLWINAGIYVFAREIEDLLPEVGDHETTTFRCLPPKGGSPRCGRRLRGSRSTAKRNCARCPTSYGRGCWEGPFSPITRRTAGVGCFDLFRGCFTNSKPLGTPAFRFPFSRE